MSSQAKSGANLGKYIASECTPGDGAKILSNLRTVQTKSKRGAKQTEPAKTEAAGVGLVDAPRLLEAIFPNKSARPSVKTLRRLVIKQAIPFVRFGGGIYFKVSDVKAVLDKQRSAQFGKASA